MKCNAGVKGHTRVNQGQPGVKLLRNVHFRIDDAKDALAYYKNRLLCLKIIPTYSATYLTFLQTNFENKIG